MRLTIISFLLVACISANAQNNFKWPNGKKSAIILTYDDALVSQLDHAIPQLKKFGITGTFFLDGRLKQQDRDRWIAASKAGNELANHSFYHPCSQSSYKANHYAEDYTVESMVAEIGNMNKLLAELDGNKSRTYAYPCGKSLAGGKDYTESLIKSGFVKYARAGSDRKSTIVTNFKKLDYFKVPSWGLAAKTNAEALIGLVKDTQKVNGMAVFMFHGIGGDYIDVSAQDHEELLKYLAANKDVWVATFKEVLDYVKSGSPRTEDRRPEVGKTESLKVGGMEKVGGFTAPVPLQIELNQNWLFKKAQDDKWLKASVPGTVHTDLLANKLIQDPYYRTNEKDVQWIDKADWIYQTTFDLPKDFESKDHIELDFVGLDTYADVYLNDKLLFKADNFFVGWKAAVKELIRTKGNQLKIYFHSPTKIGLAALKKNGFALPSPNDQSEVGAMGIDKVGIFLRKPGYHFGWDWGPRLVTSGIWQPVVLKAWNSARITDVFYEQQKVNASSAEILVHLNLQADKAGEMEVSLFAENQQLVKKTIEVNIGENSIIFPVTVANPILWWPHNLGKPHLYNFTLNLIKGNLTLQSQSKKIGIRDVQIIRKPDAAGSSFYVQINGVPVFSKGANYIPQDVFIPRVSDAKYKSLLQSALAANINMLRVWGGGFYEKDIFYNLCDEYGIMVWQDFMFACSMFPTNQNFLDQVRDEAIYNVKRLRSHPSIMLWCGNNEIDQAWGNYQEKAGWGWKQRYTEVQQGELWTTYQKIFTDILPDAIKQQNPKAFYWTSSPYNKKYIHASDTTKNGDMHYWGVWHGEHDFEAFSEHIGRFMSEYGFQSFPEFKTVKKFTVPADWKIESEVMMAHQRAPIGNTRIKSYLEKYYHFPTSFQHQLYLGQVLQAEGMKVAMETHRRGMPFNMGSLYWQINDCWPVASWSGMDYDQNWKGLHYFVKKAFQNVIVSPFIKDEKLFVHVVSDSLANIKATLNLAVKDFNGKVIWETNQVSDIKANTSQQVYQVPLATILKMANRNEVFFTASIKDGTKEIASNILYFDRIKNIKLPFANINFKEKKVNGGIEISLKTNTLAKNVYLNYDNVVGHFSDNYFDLLPGETKTVFFRTTNFIKEKLQILTVKDTYTH